MHTAPELHAELSTSEFHLGGQAKICEAAWAWRVARPTLPVLGEASGAGEIALVSRHGSVPVGATFQGARACPTRHY